MGQFEKLYSGELSRVALPAVVCLSFLFYVVSPLIFAPSSRDTITFTKSIILTIIFLSYPATFWFGYCRSPFVFSSAVRFRSIKLLAWACCATMISQISYLFYLGANPFGPSRDELYYLREATQGSLQSLLGFFAAALSGLSLRLASGRFVFFVCAALVIVLDVLTLSRGFILTVMLSFIIVGRSFRLAFLIFLLSLAITLVRFVWSSDGSSFVDIVPYLFGESVNIFVGATAFDVADFSVSILQGARPILGAIPGLGRVLEVPSEALEYNVALRDAFGMYGHAFGIVGFAKFSSIFVILVFGFTSISGVFLIGVFRILDPVVFIALLTACLVIFFRWSPGEAMTLFFRSAVVMLFFQIFVQFIMVSGR